MTDEQIMIDGCNVLKCRYYQYKTLKDCEMRYPESGDCEMGLLNYLFNGNLDMEKLCVDNPNCYFKQLARKTQECEELKIKLMQKDEVNTFFNTPIEGWSSNPCDICESKNNYEQLKHECEELKEKLNTAQFNFEQKCNVLKNIGVVQNNNGGYQIPELNLYRKALKEVEGMLQVIVKTNNVYPLQSNLYKILDIINKAKGEASE